MEKTNLAENLTNEQIHQMDEVLRIRNMPISFKYIISDHGESRDMHGDGGGSGFILQIKNEQAQILTCWHVIDKLLGLPGRGIDNLNSIQIFINVYGKWVEIKPQNIRRLDLLLIN